jgi:prevent-host-death family protein
MTSLEDRMAETTYNIYEAKTALSRLVERAAAGEEIVIAKAGRPMARLVPLAPRPRRREPGGWEGQVRIADDFDAPLPDDVLDSFEGEGA